MYLCEGFKPDIFSITKANIVISKEILLALWKMLLKYRRTVYWLAKIGKYLN